MPFVIAMVALSVSGGSMGPLSGRLGGAIGGLGTALLGVPHIFFLPAVLTGLGALGMVYVSYGYKPSSVGFVSS